MSAPRSSSVVPLGDSAPRLASISCCYRCSAAVAADDGDDESFAEGVRRAGSCDHRRSAAGGGTIRGGVVGVNIGAAFAVGVIGLLPPPPHDGKRRKAVAITAGASVGASSPLVPNYLRPERRTHALARSLAPETRKTRATATAVAAAAAAAARYGWVVARTHARSPLATAAARSVGRFFHPTSVRLSTGLHSSEWSSGREIKFCATARPDQNKNHKILTLPSQPIQFQSGHLTKRETPFSPPSLPLSR